MSERILRNEADQDARTMTASAQSTVSPAKLQKATPLSATDDEAHIPVKEGRRSRSPSRERKVDKRSPEYVWKSGLAGGLAGCAVSQHSHKYLARA
jgi:solute carrier family 25 protein 16